MTHDYSDYVDASPEDSVLGKLRNLAVDYKKAELEVSIKEAELKSAQQVLKTISEQQLPELMEEQGIPSFTTEDGLEISIKETLRCSIAGERAGAALRWLEDKGYGNIISREFKVEFGKDQEEWAAKFAEELDNYDIPLQTTVNKTVHNTRLRAFLTNLLEDGVEVPLETFGAFRQKIAKVKMRKK